MRTIKKIFIDDVVGLVKNFFALVIVVGICFLPALYAWFNIYSNWDPYGNTGALKFAAISLDKGYTDENGEYHNQGDTIIENLHENTAVDWQFVKSADEAIEGVYSGKYYAAVVVDKDFTYNMYNVFTEEIDRPTLHFYENQKKNPVATKISDTVVQTLQNNINVAFTEVVVSGVFSSASDFSVEIQEQGGVDKVLEKLRGLSGDLTRYQNTINTIIANDAALKSNLNLAKTDASNLKNQAEKSAKAIGNTAGVSGTVNTTLDSYSKDISEAMDIVYSKSQDMRKNIDVSRATEDANKMASTTKQFLMDAADVEYRLAAVGAGIPTDKIDTYKNTAISLLDGVIAIKTILNLDTSNEISQRESIAKIDATNIKEQSAEVMTKAEKNKEAISNIDTNQLVANGSDQLKKAINEADAKTVAFQDAFNNKLRPGVSSNIASLTKTLNDTNTLLNSVGSTFGNLMVMFDAINGSIDCANTSLEKTGEAITYVNGRLIDVINNVEKAGESEKLQVLVNALSGDPEVYGKFFSTPVDVVTEAVYPIENYGSAVAPFYSTLAFWVGALILTAIIKVTPDKNKYPNASQRQLYFGRYALYWVLGQLQSIIIVAGDIFLLHVQCIHPGLFFLAGSFIATTFTLLIYSLVVTWGDAGKALAVVLVVIQIAGSSGTYPIELLPEFFKKVYIFFPFPYAINAIRECLCGMYELDYLKYLGTLIVFMGVSLVIGLLIRIPFEPINHYMEERMEDTKMM
ncbi:MAG: YhgE/Pip domain-containing protein [Pseudobutyrivibrio sp.]|uniref:YhgE/Pip family protein n=1 Tax=Pseudobutyrivibrio sp. TaxID=2014367 RepID=UPI0025EECCBB|nr:YhgE/Pip domain-containing protein [Pseudobutyrivibrio sp.]MBQ6462042.1 YhgE/Pip domain-containing protein [Pseudobutyrivibrio sp.]